MTVNTAAPVPPDVVVAGVIKPFALGVAVNTTVAPDIGVPSASFAVTTTLALAPAATVVEATPSTRIVEVPGSAVNVDR